MLSKKSTREVAAEIGVDFGTIHNWIKHYKKSCSKQEAEKLDAVMKANGNANKSAAQGKFRDANLKRAMKMLSNGMTQKEVADEIGVSKFTIRSWKQHAEQAAA